jgi:hypothetical protein
MIDGMLLILRRQAKVVVVKLMAAPAKKNAPTSSRPRLLGVLLDIPYIIT